MVMKLFDPRPRLMYVPRNEIELLTIIVNCLADRKVRIGDVHFIRSLVSQGDINWDYFFSLIDSKNLFGVLSVLGIVKLKDLLFYEGLLQTYFPDVKKARFSCDSIFEPVV